MILYFDTHGGLFINDDQAIFIGSDVILERNTVTIMPGLLMRFAPFARLTSSRVSTKRTMASKHGDHPIHVHPVSLIPTDTSSMRSSLPGPDHSRLDHSIDILRLY